MSLIGNYSLLNRTIGRKIGASVSLMNGEDYSPTSARRNRVTAFGKTSGTPPTYLAPISWVLPNSGGLMGASNLLNITGNISGAAGRNLEGPMSSSITVTNAQLDQIVSFIASALLTMTASGELQAAVEMQASAILALTTNANIQAIIDVLAYGNTIITPNAILTALAHMNAEAGGPTPLSPEGLAQAVWGTNSSDYISDTGTFGYQLANSGTGLSPVDIANEVWSTDISTYTIPNTAGDQLNSASGATGPTPTDIANAVWDKPVSENNASSTFGNLIQKLLTIGKFLGLK